MLEFETLYSRNGRGEGRGGRHSIGTKATRATKIAGKRTKGHDKNFNRHIETAHTGCGNERTDVQKNMSRPTVGRGKHV